MEQEEIKKLQEENQRLVDLNSQKTDLVSINVHQIRTSLSALKWIIKMFLDGDLGKLNAEQEELLRKAFDSTNRGISVVNELLLANKTENITEKEYSLTDIDILDIIDTTIFDYSGEAINKGIEVIFLKPEKKIEHLQADKEKIRIIVQNLIDNAIKYSNPHGKIFITLTEKDNVVQFSIKNTGVIISEEGAKNIFQKFYRDPEAKKKEAVGSGIGLYTIKKIVEKHGGKIWFESGAERNTTFFFTIPKK